MIANILKNVLGASVKFGAAYGVAQGVHKAADIMDQGNILPHSFGPAITGLMRLGADAGLAGLGLGLATRTAGRVLGNQSLMKFSSTKLAGEVLFGGKTITPKFLSPVNPMKRAATIPSVAKLAGKGLASVGLGLAKTPLVLASDVLRPTQLFKLPGLRSFDKVMKESWGSRFFGIGLLAGAGSVAMNVNGFPSDYPPGPARSRPYNEPALSLGGSQTYDPVSGSKAYGENLAAAGLVQSLHLLRRPK